MVKLENEVTLTGEKLADLFTGDVDLKSVVYNILQKKSTYRSLPKEGAPR